MTKTMRTPRVKVSFWDIDPAHTLVQFGVRHMMISTVRGHFTTVDGTVQVDEHDLTASNAEATIAVNSIDTRQPDRDAHLKGPDFLDAERHPVIHFRSTRVSHGRPGGLLMTGELTIRGVTREVVFNVDGPTPPVPDPTGQFRIGVSAHLAIDRRDFGITWNQVVEMGGVLVGNMVDIRIDAELTKRNVSE